MSLIEHLIGSPEQYLFERDASPDLLTSFPEVIPGAMRVWLWEAFGRGRSVREMAVSGLESDVPLSDRLLSGMQISMEMDWGDRSSNGLLMASLVDNRDSSKASVFGRVLNRAQNNPMLADHNFEHGSRRVAAQGEAIVLNVGSLRHEKSLRGMSDAMQLFYTWHDVDQLITLQRNIDEGRVEVGDELPAKKGHDLAGAVMLLVLHQRYAKERNIRSRDAWRTCAFAAAMVALHYKVDGFWDRINARDPGYYIEDGAVHYYSVKKMLAKWEANELDILRMTPVSLVRLLIQEKQAHGFVTGDSVYGLHPAFEQEYQEELESLMEDHRPLIVDLSEKGREQFYLGNEIVIKADVDEMVTPPVEAINRTLLEKTFSLNRPFWRQETVDEVLRLGIEGPANLSLDKDSCVRRKLWEYNHVTQHHDSEVLSESRYLKRQERENALMGILAFKVIGKKIMQGDLSIIDQAYENRIKKITLKALKKAGYERVSRWLIGLGYSYLKDKGYDSIQYIENLLAGKNYPVGRYSGKIVQLRQQAREIKQNLANRPDGVDGLKVYSQEEIDSFERVIDEAIEILCRRYDISKKELRRFRSMVENWQYPRSLPFSSFDSLGGEPKTLLKPVDLVTEISQTDYAIAS